MKGILGKDMAIITLTSDWGTKDYYLAVVKGRLTKQLPEVKIIDITHDIPPFNNVQAAFVLRNCYKDFPDGTIHIIAVNTEESDKNPHTVVYADKQYFIGADDGIFSTILDNKPEKIVEITVTQDSDYFTFSTRDRFIKAATHILKNKKIEELGAERKVLNQKISFKPVTESNVIKGMVIYIDNYKNVITNITQDLFEKFRKGRKFRIILRGEVLKKLHQSYTDVPVGEIVTLFNTSGLLEIAINQGNASSLLGLYLDDTIRIEFE